MNRNRWPAMLLGVAAVVGMAAACAGTGAGDVADPVAVGDEVAASETVEDPPAPRMPSSGLLYVSQAGSAQVEGDWPTVTVTLSDVDAEVLWFQDRPGRDAGEMRMAAFVDQWDEVGFSENPPNAVIRHDAGDGLGTVVEMSDPIWDQPGGRLSFTATVADYESGDEPLPWLMSDVSLFIDDSGSVYHSAILLVSNASAGQEMAVSLVPDGSSAPGWSMGAPGSPDGGATLRDSSGVLVLESLSIGPTEVALQTRQADSVTALDFQLKLFIEVPPGTQTFYVRSDGDPGVEVQLALDGGAPQVVNPTETLFDLDAP